MPSVRKIVVTPYLCQYDVTHNRIVHDDQTTWRENFYSVDRAAGHGKNFATTTRMMTRDLFAVGNLLVIIVRQIALRLQFLCVTFSTAATDSC